VDARVPPRVVGDLLALAHGVRLPPASGARTSGRGTRPPTLKARCGGPVVAFDLQTLDLRLATPVDARVPPRVD